MKNNRIGIIKQIYQRHRKTFPGGAGVQGLYNAINNVPSSQGDKKFGRLRKLTKLG